MSFGHRIKCFAAFDIIIRSIEISLLNIFNIALFHFRGVSEESGERRKMTDFIFEWFFFFILPFMLLLKGLKPIWRKTLGPCFNTGLDWLGKQVARLGKQVASLWNTFYATIKEKLSNKQRKEIAEAGNEYDICESGDKRGSESSVTGNHESEYDVTGSNATGSNVIGSHATGSDGNGSDVPGNDVRGIYVTGSSIDRSNVTVSDMNESHVTASDVSGSVVTESNLGRFTGSHESGNSITGSDMDGSNVTGSDDARSGITISNIREHVYNTTCDNTESDVTGSVVTGSYGSGSDVTVRDDAENYGSASGISQTSRSTISETNDRLYN